MTDYDVLVAGAGIAGCALAIRLAMAGRRVALLEKDAFPRHKLCGEFLSPETLDQFNELGLMDAVLGAGARSIGECVLAAARGAVFRAPLPGAALGLSRYALDSLMVSRARELGATVRDSVSVTGISGAPGAFTASTGAGLVSARMAVGAFGRRSGLDSALSRRRPQPGPYVAFKQHYHAPDFPARIEVHGVDSGYCGVSPVEHGRVNVCAIVQERRLDRAAGSFARFVQETLSSNPRLFAVISPLEAAPGTLRAVSRPSLAPRSKQDQGVWMIGDAAGMIAPLCGDGMGMALAGAELAARAIEAHLAGTLDFDRALREYALSWNRAFGRRLAIGRAVHAAAVRAGFRDLAVAACAAHPALGRWIIEQTRGTVI